MTKCHGNSPTKILHHALGTHIFFFLDFANSFCGVNSWFFLVTHITKEIRIKLMVLQHFQWRTAAVKIHLPSIIFPQNKACDTKRYTTRKEKGLKCQTSHENTLKCCMFVTVIWSPSSASAVYPWKNCFSSPWRLHWQLKNLWKVVKKGKRTWVTMTSILKAELKKPVQTFWTITLHLKNLL